MTRTLVVAKRNQSRGGRVLGGAFGTQFANLDFMLFDGQNSVQVVERILLLSQRDTRK